MVAENIRCRLNALSGAENGERAKTGTQEKETREYRDANDIGEG